jgi:DeoR/GlpR family transcriptional regulator of sugar metabolism
MLSAERELHILSLLDSQGAVTVRELAKRFDVTEVTIRRDLQRMETKALLRRTHGGAVAIEHPTEPHPPNTPLRSSNGTATDVDALIIAPVNNRAAHTLREKAIRNKIPFLAESSPQDGAIYLGSRNFEAGHDLGVWAGEYIQTHFDLSPVVLDITQQSLSNTLERSRGFITGLHDVLGDDVSVLSVDGKALYDQSYQVAADALRANAGINTIFGINDDSLMAGIQAYLDAGCDIDNLLAVNVGGEGSTIFNELVSRDAFKACVVLFPELVGRMGIDAVSYLWAGESVGEAIYTPHRLLTAETLPQYYEQIEKNTWQLKPTVINELVEEQWLDTPPKHEGKHASFVIHYRTHEWYQNIAEAMETRARALGIRFSVQDVKDDLAAEIRDLRRLIGKLAASYVNDGDTVILDAGSTTAHMAQFLSNHKNLTVVTNALDVLYRLKDCTNIQVVMTGGEYDPEANALIGRGSHLLLEEIRADKAFLVAGGLSSSFGMSSVNAREAEVRRHMIHSAKETIVLADHTVIGVDANIKVCDLGLVNTIITDAGIRAEQSLALTRMGIEVIVAGQVSRRDTGKEVVGGH